MTFIPTTPEVKRDMRDPNQLGTTLLATAKVTGWHILAVADQIDAEYFAKLHTKPDPDRYMPLDN